MMASSFFEMELNHAKRRAATICYSAPSYFAEHPFSAILIQKIASNWKLATSH